jgi:hypothetical protein
MSRGTLLDKSVPEAPSKSQSGTTRLAVCCVCGLLRDETKDFIDAGRWVTNRTYWETYGVNAAECLLTLTCCPRCAPSKRHYEDRDIIGGPGAA